MEPNPTVTYDEEADILYINIYNPPLEADNSKMTGSFIWRYKDEKPIGLTVLNFMKGGDNPEWWEMLEWEQMERTWNILPEKTKNRIREAGISPSYDLSDEKPIKYRRNK